MIKIKNLLRPLWSFLYRQFGVYRLKKGLKNNEIKIVVGSGNISQKGWIPTEKNYLNLLDENEWNKFFKENNIDAILAEHVWEHLSLEEGFIAAKTCYRFLKKGAYLRVAVPDGYNPDSEYIDLVKPGGSGGGADDHKILYNYQSFSTLFEKVGFSVKLLEYFDENGKFSFIEWEKDNGLINRSRRYDPRNKNRKLNYTSLILDAIKQ